MMITGAQASVHANLLLCATVQCKHQITVQVWEALGRCKKQMISDADLVRELMHSIGHC
jgi:hypothetical protein